MGLLGKRVLKEGVAALDFDFWTKSLFFFFFFLDEKNRDLRSSLPLDLVEPMANLVEDIIVLAHAIPHCLIQMGPSKSNKK